MKIPRFEILQRKLRNIVTGGLADDTSNVDDLIYWKQNFEQNKRERCSQLLLLPTKQSEDFVRAITDKL